MLAPTLERYAAGRVVLDSRPLYEGDRSHPEVLDALHEKPDVPVSSTVYNDVAFIRLILHPDPDSNRRYIDEWERMSDRIGFWLDREGYATYHRYYVESVWWALSEFFKQGLLYQGYKSVWWWPQGGTALSQGEVGEGYRPVDDPAVVVRFRLEDGRALLAWTTTPWTLPSNLALAVAADETYVEAVPNDEEAAIWVADIRNRIN